MNVNRLLEKARAQDSLIAIFTLILGGGEASRLEAAELIRKLTPEQKRDLRGCCQDVEALVDEVFLQQLAEQRRKRQ